jgi:hypothetical protein
MRGAVTALGAHLVFALSACGAPTPQSDRVLRSDSAGVRIVTSTGPDTTLPWRIEPIDVLKDSLGEPWLFTLVSPQMVITDRAGRTYVLEREPAIRRFGRDGVYERSIGRKGGAPGEMLFPTSLVQQGDSLVVHDGSRNAMVRWGSDLEPIGDIQLRDAFQGAQRVAFRSGGAWVQRYSFDSTSRRTELIADTTTAEALFAVANTGQPKTIEACGGMIAFAMPTFFAPELHWANSGARMLANRGPGYDLRLYEGPRLIASVRRDLPSRAASAADLDAMFPEGLKYASCTIETTDLIRAVGLAEQMPFVHGLALLSDGTMWVQRSVRQAKPPVLDVFASDGAYAGTVTGFYLPVGLLPNGELLVPRDDEESGGLVITRMRVVK